VKEQLLLAKVNMLKVNIILKMLKINMLILLAMVLIRPLLMLTLLTGKVILGSQEILKSVEQIMMKDLAFLMQ
jgi:hypothetical protein